jgi:hypothetical protein
MASVPLRADTGLLPAAQSWGAIQSHYSIDLKFHTQLRAVAFVAPFIPNPKVTAATERRPPVANSELLVIPMTDLISEQS